MYYGDELGMEQVEIAPEDVQDPFEKNVPGIGVGRDGCRTPMQWDASANAGFSDARPWLPPAPDATQDNVANLRADAESILNLYRALLRLRRQLPQLALGDYQPLAAEGDLLLYRRHHQGQSVLVALNLGPDPISAASDAIGLDGEVLLSTMLDRAGERIGATLDLRGNEGIIVGRAPEEVV
jgi:alpha-glucosidase